MRVFGGRAPKKLFKIDMIYPPCWVILAVDFTTIIYILAKTIHKCQANFQYFIKNFNFFYVSLKIAWQSRAEHLFVTCQLSLVN